MPHVSAGLLIYRRGRGGRGEPGEAPLQVLLVHPGGPYWAKKDRGAWSIPKGLAEPSELAASTGPSAAEGGAAGGLLAVALRETSEETGLRPPGPFVPLGGVKAHQHKLIYAWAVEHDCDPSTIVSNTFTIEWPPRSGRQAEFPEVDRAAWFDLAAAREAIVPAQRRFVDELVVVVGAAP
jgi:predicted NUDIX family NTP pyrophosphohydrolase